MYTNVTGNCNKPLYYRQVNINGDISFGQGYTGFTPTPFPLDVEIPIVAAYFTDLHTNRTGEEEIYYREDTTQEILQVQTHCEFGSV